MDKKIAIEFKNVSKSFQNKSKANKQVLKDMSFNVYEGEFHGFIGTNGAGKTTTFRSLLYFYPDVKGDILIEGVSFRDAKSKSSIGYIPEVATFPRKLTIYEFLQVMAKLSGLSKEQATKRIDEALKKFNIDMQVAKSRTGKQLSSGQQKKILLIQALINDPKILILDEPAANLDPEARIELYQSLKELQKEGKTIFLSSHILAELQAYIDSLTVLKEGQVQYSGSMAELSFKLDYQYKFVPVDIKKASEFFKSYKSKDKEFKYLLNEDAILINCSQAEEKELMKKLVDEDIDIKSIGNNSVDLNKTFFGASNVE